MDDKWTRGNRSTSSGYMQIGTVADHRVVATAFHGEQLTPGHVVDHYDTNRENNRPENLWWVTRRENLEKNPKTLSRIEKLFGSVDGLELDGTLAKKNRSTGSLPWSNTVSYGKPIPTVGVESLSPIVLQRNWKTKSEFPACPTSVKTDALYDYCERSSFGAVSSKNEYGESVAVLAETGKERKCLSVICKMVGNPIKD